MQSMRVDLGSIRVDDVALILNEAVRYYERAHECLQTITDDEYDRLIQQNRRDMNAAYLRMARSRVEKANDPECWQYNMTALRAAEALAEAAQWYGVCLEANSKHFTDREAAIKYIKKRRAEKAARGQHTWI